MLPNWVGDCVMATPALQTLRRELPEARIVGIARPYLIPLLEGTRWLDQILPWEHKGPGRLTRTWRLTNQLRNERLDVLILLRAGLSAGIAARFSSAKYTIGYARRGLGWLLTNPVKSLHQGRASTPVSAVDEYLRLVGELVGVPGWLGSSEASPRRAGIDLPSPPATHKRLELAITPAGEAAA